MNVRDYLIEDIKHLSVHDVNKLYKYVRRYLVANIEELVDPLEPTSNSKYKQCPNCGEMSDFVNSIGCRHCLYWALHIFAKR